MTKKFLFVLLAAALIQSCRQMLETDVTVSQAAPADFFWTASQLDSGLDYYMIRPTESADHLIMSSDGIHIEDRTLNRMAFRMRLGGDTIAIDSIGTNSIFSIPAGYYFAGDSDVQQPGTLKLLVRDGLHIGGSWKAGTLAGPLLGAGVAITGRVLDSVQTLSLPTIGPVDASMFGESFRVRYAHDSSSGAMDASFPLYWIVYYTRSLGPVLIEGYLDSAGSYSLESQAVLRRK